VAGTGKKGFTGNGGPAKKATLSGPKGIAVGPKGNIYLADTESHTVRMIDRKTGKLELIAGDGKKGDGPEGKDLKKCRMDRLHGVFVDEDGAIYIGDTNTHRIRVVRP
jgi:DNA-binding beta-propeller fold protein YncE